MDFVKCILGKAVKSLFNTFSSGGVSHCEKAQPNEDISLRVLISLCANKLYVCMIVH